MTEYTPDIITALSALDLSDTDTSEELTSHQTHQLALALLTRNGSQKKLPRHLMPPGWHEHPENDSFNPMKVQHAKHAALV